MSGIFASIDGCTTCACVVESRSATRAGHPARRTDGADVSIWRTRYQWALWRWLIRGSMASGFAETGFESKSRGQRIAGVECRLSGNAPAVPPCMLGAHGKCVGADLPTQRLSNLAAPGRASADLQIRRAKHSAGQATPPPGTRQRIKVRQRRFVTVLRAFGGPNVCAASWRRVATSRIHAEELATSQRAPLCAHTGRTSCQSLPRDASAASLPVTAADGANSSPCDHRRASACPRRSV